MDMSGLHKYYDLTGAARYFAIVTQVQCANHARVTFRCMSVAKNLVQSFSLFVSSKTPPESFSSFEENPARDFVPQKICVFIEGNIAMSEVLHGVPPLKIKNKT